MSRVAVVTGAASGVGLGIAERLAREGNAVALLDLQAEVAEQAAEKLRIEGLRAMAAAVDVSDRASVDDAIARVREAFGPTGIVVTSAGIDRFDDFTALTPEAWERTLAVNLTGTFHCIQACVGDMIEAQWGRIVTIASSSALSGAPRMAAYTASKGGVISLTKTLAMDLGRHGITANTITPSLVDTPMARAAEAKGDVAPFEALIPNIPIGRAGTPQDIAAACAYLCSDEAGYVTGQEIGVNGGFRI